MAQVATLRHTLASMFVFFFLRLLTTSEQNDVLIEQLMFMETFLKHLLRTFWLILFVCLL